MQTIRIYRYDGGLVHKITGVAGLVERHPSLDSYRNSSRFLWLS